MFSHFLRLLSVCVVTGALLNAPAQAQPAVAPLPDPRKGDNCVIFPNRDFMNCEGLARYVGMDAKVSVFRGNKLVGATDVEIAVDTSGVAFEVNHPGGYCWGWGRTKTLDGSNPTVTPDIVAGDVVQVAIDELYTAAVTVGGAAVTSVKPVGTNAIQVKGTLTGLTPAQINGRFVEVRIVNPDMVDIIGKRDIRAVSDVMTVQDDGYSSQLALNAPDNTFVADFVFDDDKVAARDLAATGDGARMMSWQAVVGGERVGITIAEFGELGGPGFGGCPPNPDGAAAPVGENAFFTVVDGKVTVKWGEAVEQPGAAAVEGYRVSLLEVVTSPESTRSTIGVDTPATTWTAELTVDTSKTYELEVRSRVTDNILGKPYNIVDPKVGPPPASTPDPPTISIVTPEGAQGRGTDEDPFLTNAVVVEFTPATAACFYTTSSADTDPPRPVDATFTTADDSKVCGASIPITDKVKLRAAVITRGGVVKMLDEVNVFAPVPDTRPPLQKYTLTATPLSGGARLTWTPPQAGSSDAVNDFLVRKYTTNDAGTTWSLDDKFGLVNLGMVVRGSTVDVPDQLAVLMAFTVEPRYAEPPKLSATSKESARVSVTPLVADDVFTIASGRFDANKRRLRISGEVSRFVGGLQVFLQCKVGNGQWFDVGTRIALTSVPAVAPATVPTGAFAFDLRGSPNPVPNNVAAGTTQCVVKGVGTSGTAPTPRPITGTSNPISV